MSATVKDLLEGMGAWSGKAAPAPEASLGPAAPVGWRLAAAAIGVSLAAVAAPIAVAVVLATQAPLWRPSVAAALLGLLVLAPAGTGLSAALAGLPPIAASLRRAGCEAENAVLRVFATTLLFLYAIAVAAAGPAGAAAAGSAAAAAPIAAAGLVGAWCWLLCVILWPLAPASRHYAAIALDLALFSAFLHAGGGEVAGWYPLYLLIVLYCGLRCGIGALSVSAASSGVGFAAVILTTESWRQQPLLAGGLLLALVLLPALVAGPIRALAAARSGAVEAAADRERTLRLIADAVGARPAPAGPGGAPSPAGDILDLAALEGGRFAPPVESFALRRLVGRALAPARAAAAEKHVALRCRIDPRLPERLRGRSEALERAVGRLAAHGVDSTPRRAVRLAIDGAAADGRRLRLRLVLDGAGHDCVAEGAEGSLALRLVRSLVGLLDGDLVVEPGAETGPRLIATVGLGVEQGAGDEPPDLDGRPVLVASEDGPLAEALRQVLGGWNAAPLWVRDVDAVLAELPVIEAPGRAVVIVDGRGRLMSALSLAHHVARLGPEAPFVLLLAEQHQIASLAEVDDGEVDGFLPMPVTAAVLANALRALPFAAEPSPRPAVPRPAPAGAAPMIAEAVPITASDRITPIAAHPRFAAENASAVDPRVVDGLRALGDGPGFLREVIESFRADARRIMERVYQAAAAADPEAFARGLVALHRAAGPLGGGELCALAASLQQVTAGELRQRGATYVQRLDGEIDRLAAALTQFLPAAEAHRQ